MECIEAQSLISDALDRSPVDADALAAAKAHCRECPQCGQYVRALSAIRRAELPQPPADLADRIMVAVRAEAEVAAQATAAATSTEPEPTPDSAAVEQPDAPEGVVIPQTPQRVSIGNGRMDRRQLIAWGSAAAMVLLVVGVSAALGVLRLVGSPGTTAETSRASKSAAVQAAPEAADSATMGSAAPDAGVAQAPSTASAPPANLYLEFGGDVYAQQGASVQSKSQLTAVGQTSMTFDAGTPPAPHTAYAGKENGVIHIEDDSGDLQRFVLVKREYRNTSYRLQSDDLTAYGAWPTIPPGIPRPVPEDNPAGTPSFALDGSDAMGTPVYRRVGSDRQIGIAIAPGSAADDPAAGNPNWTWWTP